MGGLVGGGGGGKAPTVTGGAGGVSNFDLNLIAQALGQNIDAIHNRYEQLGIGLPSLGTGGSLSYAGPSTMEEQDILGQAGIGNAAIGQLQLSNLNNKFAPGSPANIGELASQQAQAQSALGSIAGSQAANNASGGGAGNLGGGGQGSLGNTPQGGTGLDAGTTTQNIG